MEIELEEETSHRQLTELRLYHGRYHADFERPHVLSLVGDPAGNPTHHFFFCGSWLRVHTATAFPDPQNGSQSGKI